MKELEKQAEIEAKRDAAAAEAVKARDDEVGLFEIFHFFFCQILLSLP